MGEAAKKEAEEEKLIPVGPGADGLETPKEDARLAQDEEEPEERPSEPRSKESARERRERAKKARERERSELNFYMKRNEDLEKRLMSVESRTSQTENAAIDQRMTSLQAQVTNAERVLVEALRKPNGAGAEEFTEALKIRDQLRDQLGTLSTHKKGREERQQEPPRVEASQPEAKPDPRIVRLARKWADDHDWYQFEGRDPDSLIVRALDESLTAEGFDPSTEDYWEELTTRAKRHLPQRFKNGAQARADEEDVDDEDERPRNTGPKFSSGGRERPLRKGEVYVSAERKQAMKDYGVWEDPVARNRMLKRYAKWDEEIASSKS